METIRPDFAVRLFQESQQASQMSVKLSNTRFDSHVWRRYCQIFSTGFNTGDFGGRGTSTIL